jgi:hypothetical protein
LNDQEVRNLSDSVKNKLANNEIGFLFTDKINELYGLDKNKKSWIIKYDKLLFQLNFTQHNDGKIIRIRTSNMSNASKIYKLLNFKEVNKEVKKKNETKTY